MFVSALVKTNTLEVSSFRYFNFHAISDHQTDLCLMIAYGVKVETTKTPNFQYVGFVHRLHELSALMGF